MRPLVLRHYSVIGVCMYVVRGMMDVNVRTVITYKYPYVCTPEPHQPNVTSFCKSAIRISSVRVECLTRLTAAAVAEH